MCILCGNQLQGGTLTNLVDKLEEYERLKRDFPRSIVFVQIGATYKTFADDAVAVSECLETPFILGFIGHEVKSVSIPSQVMDERVKRLTAAGYEIVKADVWGLTLSKPTTCW